MKRLLLFLILLMPIVTAANNVELYLFYGQGCPHCEHMIAFLESIKDDYPTLNVNIKEVYHNDYNRDLLMNFCTACNEKVQGVPTVFIDKKMFVGYSTAIASQIEANIKRCMEQECESFGDDGYETIMVNSDPIAPAAEPYHYYVGYSVIAAGIIVVLYFIAKKLRWLK